jgi:hypothetical protein
MKRLLCLLALLLSGTPSFAAVAKDGPASGPIIRRPFNPKDRRRLPDSWAIAGQRYVSQREYGDLKGGVLELLKRYPPNKYFFVGLGRDPAPVIAFLQNLGEKQLAVNLPGTSNVGWDGEVRPVDVARYVEAAIPERVLQGKRDLVILDVTGTGKTPATFGPYLERYLASRKLDKRVVRLAFSWNHLKQRGMGYDRDLTDWIDTRPWADFSNYFSGKYEGSWTPQDGGEGVAEHERHRMGAGVVPPKLTNPNYRNFRKALLARMRQDEELDAFLAQAKGMSAKVDRVVDLEQASAERAAALETLPARMAKSATDLVARLDRIEPRVDPTQTANGYGQDPKLPQLSPNGRQMATWLRTNLVGRRPGLERNQVALHFIVDTMETAIRNSRIDGIDYRRLLGQALSVAAVDETMLGLIAARYDRSPSMQHELRAGKELFMRGEQCCGNPVTSSDRNMTGNYRLIMTKLAPRVKLQ